MKRLTSHRILRVCLYSGICCSCIQFFSGCSCVPPPPSASKQTETKNRASKEQPSTIEQENTTDGKSDTEAPTSADGSSSDASAPNESSGDTPNQPASSSTEPKPKGVHPIFGLGTRPNSSGSSRQPSTPAQARDEAKSLQAKAERQHAAGKSGDAFLSATKAWELVRAHPADAECQQLAMELFPLVERLGEAAEKSSPRREAFTTRPLQVK